MTDELSLFSMAVWTVKEGMEDEFISAWTTFAEWTNDNQHGAMGVYLTRERSNPEVFVTFGSWENDDDLLRWRNTEEFKGFFARARELCTRITPLTLDTVTTIGAPKIFAGE
jgi:heme-degrading monooxygenase HmoA